MKNPKLKYALLVAVALIWGVIGYRIVGAVSGDDDFASGPVAVAAVAAITIQSDTFEINNDYSDPFLDRKLISFRASSYTAQNSGVTQQAPPAKSVPAKKPVKTEPSIKWPKITYKGTSTGNGRTIGVWEVGGKSGLLNEGDILNDVEVVQMWVDSAKVRFNETEQVVRLNQPFDMAVK